MNVAPFALPTGGEPRVPSRIPSSTRARPSPRLLWTLALLIAAFLPPGVRAQESAEEIFKRALFEEEGHRNFEVAVRDYERVVQAMDQQRRLAATALFRLGECYRKLNRTNDAVAQYQRILKEFPAEPTLVQLSEQNLTALGASFPGATLPRSATTSDPGASKNVGAPGFDDSAATERLAAQLVELRRLKDDSARQARAVQALFPDTTLEKLLTGLPVLQKAVEKVAGLKHYPSVSDTNTVLFQGPGASGLLEMRALENYPNASPADEQRLALEQHVGMIAERVDFVLGLQEARLQVLQAAERSLGPRTPGSGSAADPRVPGPLQRRQEIAQLEVQLALARKEDLSPETRRRALRSFFPADSKGLEDLERQLTNAQIQDARLSTTLGEEHPTRQGLRREGKLFEMKLDQEAAQILEIQEARLKVLRATAEQLDGPPAASKTAPDSNGTSGAATTTPTPSQQENAEILRIQGLVANSPDLINAYSQNPPGTPLYVAASKGQLGVARYLLDHGALVNGMSSGSSPIHAAVGKGHKAMAELLIERGAAVNAIDYQGRTPLHHATQLGFQVISQVLLAHGANPNLIAPRPAGGGDPDGRFGSPLYAAVERGHLDLIQLLLDKGADPNARDQDGDPATDWTAPPLTAAPSIETVRLLLAKGANPNLFDYRFMTRLDYAASQGQTEIAEALIQAGAQVEGPTNRPPNVRHTPLALAVDNKRRDTAEVLLKHGASIDTESDGHSPLGMTLERADFEWVTWALDRGANPNSATGEGPTPLQLALTCDDQEFRGETGGGSASNVRGGPPVPSRVPTSIPVPGVVSRPGAPASPQTYGPRDRRYELGRFVGLLLERGANLRQPFSDGHTLLHHLSQRNLSAAGWMKLAKWKPDPSVVGPRKVTPLMVAVCNGARDSATALLAAGADVNAQDELGNSALHFATYSGSAFFIARLLEAKASTTVTNFMEQRPIDLVGSGVTYSVDSMGIILPQRSAYASHLGVVMPAASPPDLQRQGELFAAFGVTNRPAPRAANPYIPGVAPRSPNPVP